MGLVEPLFPALFVLLWSTGFVGARYAMPHAEPFTFLALRFALALAVLGPLGLVAMRGRGVRPAMLAHAAFAGFLIHGVYLGGVFFAVRHGLPAGIVALVAGLQPLLTALLAAPLLGERIAARHWLGLGVGLLGVALVVAPRLGQGAGGNAAMTLLPAFAGVAAIALGTVWQKRFVADLDLRIGAVAQYVGAAVPVAAAGFLVETGRIEWSAPFVLSLLWLALALSIGAVLLLLVLIRRGAVSRVASLFYLVPAVTALMSYALFGERLEPVQLAGMALAAGGVAAATGAIGRKRAG